jgi:hypothetical protein
VYCVEMSRLCLSRVVMSRLCNMLSRCALWYDESCNVVESHGMLCRVTC